MGVPRCEQQHCAPGQRGQLGGPRCGRRVGRLDGRARGQMAGPLRAKLLGQQIVLEGEPLCELSEQAGGLAEQLREPRELCELLDELRAQVDGLFGEQGGQERCDDPSVELGGLQQHLPDGGHCGDVRRGEGQGRVT